MAVANRPVISTNWPADDASEGHVPLAPRQLSPGVNRWPGTGLSLGVKGGWQWQR